MCGGAVTHSGDNRTGDGDGDDEWVRINVDKLPSEVSVIMFVVNAYSGGSFLNVETARAELREVQENGTKKVVSNMYIGGSGSNTALIMSSLRRGQTKNTWISQEIAAPAHGQDW